MERVRIVLLRKYSVWFVLGRGRRCEYVYLIVTLSDKLARNRAHESMQLFFATAHLNRKMCPLPAFQ